MVANELAALVLGPAAGIIARRFGLSFPMVLGVAVVLYFVFALIVHPLVLR